MQYLHKKTNTVYFDADDLKALFEAPSRLALRQKIEELGMSPTELFADKEKIKEVLSGLNIIKDKEDIEIFTALYSMLNFYPGAKIGFPLRDSINLEKTP